MKARFITLMVMVVIVMAFLAPIAEAGSRWP